MENREFALFCANFVFSLIILLTLEDFLLVDSPVDQLVLTDSVGLSKTVDISEVRQDRDNVNS